MTGGNLPSIHSSEEQSTLTSMISSSDGDRWIGLYNGMWLDGSSFSSNDYSNYYNGLISPGNGCYATDDNSWNYSPCSALREKLICQYQLNPGWFFLYLISLFNLFSF